MTRDDDHFEEYHALSEIKLSQSDREDIWDGIELGIAQGTKRTRIHKQRRGLSMIKSSAAVVAALALFGGGIGYELHHSGSNTKPGASLASHPRVHTSTSKKHSQLNYASEIALIKDKGYSVNGTTPNVTVRTASGASLSAWLGIRTQSDGHNQFVFFFLNGKYLGTDTANPSLEITSVKSTGNSIAVTYPVYKKNDSFANPTGTPVTIRYTWNGAKLVPNKPYPKQFQPSNATSLGNNLISTTYDSTTAQAANQVEQIGGSFSASGQKINLGLGITAWATAGMGQARYEWSEGNWDVEIRFYTVNRGVKQVAENMVSYLHTHWLPAPNNHGVIVVQSTAPSSSNFKWNTTIAWQEGTKVNQLKQIGSPIQALQTVVHKK